MPATLSLPLITALQQATVQRGTVFQEVTVQQAPPLTFAHH